MNSNPHNSTTSGPGTGEETLRLIASLPSPEGLNDRVHAALRVAHDKGLQRPVAGAGIENRGRVLAWPSALNPQSSWMRTAAAAAIVFVVAGGGWGVYTRIEQGQPAKVIVMPSRMPASGGFSNAGAMRTPQTLPGPTVLQPVAPKPAQPKPAKKPATRPPSKVPGSARSPITSPTATQPN